MDEWTTLDHVNLSTVTTSEAELAAVVTESGGRTRNQKRKADEVHEEEEHHAEFDQNALREHEEFTKVKNVERIELGRYEMETWYFSPLPQEYNMCKVCSTSSLRWLWGVRGGGGGRGHAGTLRGCSSCFVSLQFYIFACSHSLRACFDTASTDYEHMALTQLEAKDTVRPTVYAHCNSYEYGHVQRQSQDMASLQPFLHMLQVCECNFLFHDNTCVTHMLYFHECNSSSFEECV